MQTVAPNKPKPLVPQGTSGFLFARIIYRPPANAADERIPRVRMRSLVVAIGLLTCIWGAGTTADAQTLGIGPRVSWVHSDIEADDDSDRYFGGVLRVGSGKLVFELAIDYRSEETDNQLVRVKNLPIQTSALFYPVKTSIAPYLLGGVGWHSTNIERSATAVGETTIAEETTRRFGWHAGVGGDLRLTRMIGMFVDYRYTFLDFGDDDDRDSPGLIPFAGQLGLSHEGSMWTWGAVVYF